MNDERHMNIVLISFGGGIRLEVHFVRVAGNRIVPMRIDARTHLLLVVLLQSFPSAAQDVIHIRAAVFWGL
jgi:hypothetical protein